MTSAYIALNVSKHPTVSISLTCRKRPITCHHFSHIRKQSTTRQSRTLPRRQINMMSWFFYRSHAASKQYDRRIHCTNFFSMHPTLPITLTCRNRPVTYHHFSHIQKQSTTPQSRTRPRRQINKMSSFLCLFADPEITCPGFSWMKSCSHIRKCLTRRRDRTRPRRRINMTSSCIALRVCQVSNSFNYYDVPQPQAHYISLFFAYIRKISPTR
jgi:hypothetical protein